MFTLKLKRRITQRIRFVECPNDIDVSTEGDRRVIKTGALTFYIGRTEEFDEAYVETSRGATTQIIRAP